MSQTCSRCGDVLDEPLTKNCNYVTCADFCEEKEVEQWVALTHTEETKEHLDALDETLGKSRRSIESQMAHPDAKETVTYDHELKHTITNIDGLDSVSEEDAPLYLTDVMEDDDIDIDLNEVETEEVRIPKKVDFAISRKKFGSEKVGDPEKAKQRDDVARVEPTYETVEVQKTGLVCPECTKEKDEIIWGVDC